MTDQMVMKRVAVKKNIQDNNLQNHTVPTASIHTVLIYFIYSTETTKGLIMIIHIETAKQGDNAPPTSTKWRNETGPYAPITTIAGSLAKSRDSTSRAHSGSRLCRLPPTHLHSIY